MSDRLWMDVASFLGMSLYRCKKEHTTRQRDEWLMYIRHHHSKGFHRADEYLAKILAELRATRSPKTNTKWTDFLIKYEFKVRKRIKQSPDVTKAILHATLGIGNEPGNGTSNPASGS